MIITCHNRGFEVLISRKGQRIASQSSAINERYADALERPGSSYLWVGVSELDREEVNELIEHLQQWCKTGSMELVDKGLKAIETPTLQGYGPKSMEDFTLVTKPQSEYPLQDLRAELKALKDNPIGSVILAGGGGTCEEKEKKP